MVAIINTVLLRVYTAARDLKARLSEERGQDLIEYAMLGGLIAVAIAAVITLAVMTGAISGMVAGIADCIDFSGGPCSP